MENTQEVHQTNMKCTNAKTDLFARAAQRLSISLLVLAVAATSNVSAWSLSGEKRPKQPASSAAPAAVSNTNYNDGQQIISKMCTTASALDNYSSSYAMAVYKSRNPQRETGVFAFKKPKLMRVEVLTGPKKGALAILAKDGKVHGHLGGALKFFKGAVSPDSSFVKAINGFPMVGTDFYSLADYLQNMLKQGNFSRVSKEPTQTSKTASPTHVLEMYTKNSGSEQLLKRIYVDPKTWLPVYWEDYTDGKLWSESSWQDLKLNVDFASDYFSG